MSKNAELILNIINKCNDHPTAETVYQRVRNSGDHLSMATVYNNLNRLCDEGKIQRVCVDGHKDRFDHIDRHDHLVCKKCGRIMDFCFSDLTDSLRLQSGENILSYELKVDYICSECRKEKGKKSL